jgi:hypothetical protein
VDVAVSADGNAVAVRENSQTLVRTNALSLFSTAATSELEHIAGRTEVPGAATHPSGALLDLPFLTGPVPALPPAVGLRAGIVDARTEILHRRIFLPAPLAMLSTDIDGQRGSFD